MTIYQNNKSIEEVGSPKVRSIPHYETYQCCVFPTQVFKLYENTSNVSCFLIGNLPHIHHYRKYSWSLPPIEVASEHEY